MIDIARKKPNAGERLRREQGLASARGFDLGVAPSRMPVETAFYLIEGVRFSCDEAPLNPSSR